MKVYEQPVLLCGNFYLIYSAVKCIDRFVSQKGSVVMVLEKLVRLG